MKRLNHSRPVSPYESDLPQLAIEVILDSGVADPGGYKHRAVLMILRGLFENGKTLEIGVLPY